tara:strand:- start:7042 stop:7587 length:546 start_codon:yes stop_codon:yes gene_type:complete
MPNISITSLMEALRADVALASGFARWADVEAHCAAFRRREMSSRHFGEALCALVGREVLARAIGTTRGGGSFLVELERNSARKRRFEELGIATWHDFPSDFLCPITHETFVDPVVASDGHTYERYALERLFAGGDTKSPLTREVMLPVAFCNHALKKRLHAYRNEVLGAAERALAEAHVSR